MPKKQQNRIKKGNVSFGYSEYVQKGIRVFYYI